ncbi:MAG: hypothetical protein L0323_07855 [Planctomycetes bacterium]|nr:hypothetical protein [Planctomycetota bacterium]
MTAIRALALLLGAVGPGARAGWGGKGGALETPPPRSPLAFVENQGQWDTTARFVARSREGIARLERNAILLQRETIDLEGGSLRGVLLRLVFEGAAPEPSQEGLGRRPESASFFLGNDPARWRTGVPAFDSVLYRSLYPGVDLRVGEREGRLAYDLLLSPGADARRVTVRCEGTLGLRVESDGSLRMETALGPVRQTRPLAWQEDAAGGRKAVRATFRLEEGNRFGFDLANLDPRLPLVIDPGIEWSTLLGGAGPFEQAQAVAVDASGAVTVAGFTSSPNFPTSPGAYDATYNGGATQFGDAFVTRLNASGTGLVFSTFLGGSGDEEATDLALDPSGGVVVVGRTASINFPSTPGSYDPNFSGGGCAPLSTNVFTCGDVFVARLDATGTALLYSTFLGGSAGELAPECDLDAGGNVAVAGATASLDFPVTPGVVDPVSNGYEAFVSRLNAAGSALVYSTFLGGSGVEDAWALAVDGAGQATVGGRTNSPDFPVTPASYVPIYVGGIDGFVSRLDPTGTTLVYSTYLGGAGNDFVFSIALDAFGGAAVAGSTFSANFPTTPGAFDPTFNGGLCNTVDCGGDGFLARLDPTGSGLVDSTYLGSPTIDRAWEVAVDPGGYAVVVGQAGPGFPTTPGASDTVHGGGFSPVGDDAYVLRLSPVGGLVYSTFVGGTGAESSYSVALPSTGGAVLVGSTHGVVTSNFPTTPGAYDTVYTPYGEAFVTRHDLLPTGASRYGASTPGCGGTVVISVNSLPQVGNLAFEITCVGGPANATGSLGFSSAGLGTPLLLGGFSLWIDPSAPMFFGASASSGPAGETALSIPIPPDPTLAAAQVFAQFAWPDPCAPGGIAGSSGLAVVVVP